MCTPRAFPRDTAHDGFRFAQPILPPCPDDGLTTQRRTGFSHPPAVAGAGQRHPMNIVDPILYRCRQSPPAAAISAPGAALGLISYARLERFIHNIGNRALKEGLRGGHIVAVQVQDQMLHALLLLGLMRLGVAVVSAAANRLPATLRVEAVLSDTPLFLGIAGVPRVITAGHGWLE